MLKSSLATNRQVVSSGKVGLKVCVPARTLVKANAKTKLDTQGFVANDNSGKANMFPTSAKPFVSSPRTEAVSTSGIGGAQGAGFLAAVLLVVVIATVGVAGGSSDGLPAASDYDSLGVIAARIQASL